MTGPSSGTRKGRCSSSAVAAAATPRQAVHAAERAGDGCPPRRRGPGLRPAVPCPTLTPRSAAEALPSRRLTTRGSGPHSALVSVHVQRAVGPAGSRRNTRWPRRELTASRHTTRAPRRASSSRQVPAGPGGHEDPGPTVTKSAAGRGWTSAGKRGPGMPRGEWLCACGEAGGACAQPRGLGESPTATRPRTRGDRRDCRVRTGLGTRLPLAVTHP